MTGKLPVVDGGPQDTTMLDWPATAATAVGALGGVGDGGVGGVGDVGVTAFDAALDPEVPMPLLAVAVNVYAVPGDSPVTLHDVAGVVIVHDPPAGLEVTAKLLGVPPDPGVTLTVADPAPATATGAAGVPGAERITADDAGLDPDVPPIFVAVVVKV